MNLATKTQARARAVALMEKGHTLRYAARDLGVSPGTLSKLLRPAGPAKRRGRPPAVGWTEQDILLARRWRLLKESVPVAAWFLMEDPAASEPVRAYLRGVFGRAAETGARPAFNLVARSAFAVTAAERDAFAGRKAAHLGAFTRERDMTVVLADGTEADILPGELWELDDYSTNQPYWWADEAGVQQLGRQILAAIDVASAGWIGFDLVARPRDAYRGEDILRFLGRLFRARGIPRYLRLERGAWDSSFIHGIEVPGMAKRWGDLGDILHIVHALRPQTKGLCESSFSILQRWLRHTGRDIGRVRGAMEEATRLARRVGASGGGAVDSGFLPLDESLAAHEAAALHINAHPRWRGHLGRRVAPDDMQAERGWHAAPWDASVSWYFLPYKRVLTVLGGRVVANAGRGWPALKYQINGTWSDTLGRHLHLEHGHRLLVAWDPAEPEAGARVCNAEPPGSPKNRDRIPLGQLLCVAPRLGRVPQLVLGPNPLDTGAQKAARSAARTAFRAIAGAGKPAATEKAIHDGAGNTIQLRGGMPGLANAPGEPAAEPPRAPREASATSAPRAAAPRGTQPPAASPRAPLPPAALAALEATAYGRAAIPADLAGEILE